MKSTTRLSLFASCLLLSALPSSALTEFKDTFTATKLHTNWKTFSDRGGKLVLNNGKLNLEITESTKEGASGAVILKAPKASTQESWAAEVTVTNQTRGGQSWTGIIVGNADSLFSNHVGIELSQFKGQLKVSSFTAANENETRVREIPTQAKTLYLRVSYDAKSKIFRLFYRTKPTAQWTSLYTYSPFNSTKADHRGDWGLNANTGRFSLLLFGGSKNPITADTITVDDFIIRNSK
jgi:hypothetical protein